MFRSDLNLTIAAPSSKSKHHSRTIRRRHLQIPNTIAAPSAVAAPPVDTATPPSTASAQPLHSVASRPRLKPSRRCTPSLLSTSRRVATAPRRWSPSPHSTANADLRHSTPRHHSTANSVHLVFYEEALVYAASHLNMIFINRNGNILEINFNSLRIQYEVLDTLEFTKNVCGGERLSKWKSLPLVQRSR
nr:phospholipid-transporting ATPase 2 isoform X1 [Ipomoea batatas]